MTTSEMDARNTQTLHALARKPCSIARRGARLRAFDHDDDERDGRAEHAAQHRGRGAHCVDARLDVPGRQQLHQQQAARRAERPAHLARALERAVSMRMVQRLPPRAAPCLDPSLPAPPPQH